MPINLNFPFYPPRYFKNKYNWKSAWIYLKLKFRLKLIKPITN